MAFLILPAVYVKRNRY